jgi:hypothetical protein
VTDPLWYGLWLSPTLSRSQCETLAVVFERLAPLLRRDNSEFVEFAAALQESVLTGAPVTAVLSPPGHVDFGWITTFPHCPRCKAEAPVKRWQNPYSETPLDCPVCGNKFSPAVTYSQEREFWSTQVQCEKCHRSFKVKEFSDPDRDLLEEQASLQELEDELKWLARVGEFYKRHPDQKNEIKLDIMRILESRDPHVQEQMCEGVPFDEIFLLAEPLPEDRAWSSEDREVIDYLKHNQFDFDARLSFVRQRLQDGADTVLNRHVLCPHCSGRIRIQSQ